MFVSNQETFAIKSCAQRSGAFNWYGGWSQWELADFLHFSVHDQRSLEVKKKWENLILQYKQVIVEYQTILSGQQ